MASLRNFINAITNDNKIYTAEDIGGMSGDEFMENEKAINYQMANLGIPRESELASNSDVVYVHAYTRDDGTEVKAHYRSKPDGAGSNNYEHSGTNTGAAANIKQPTLLEGGITYNDYPTNLRATIDDYSQAIENISIGDLNKNLIDLELIHMVECKNKMMLLIFGISLHKIYGKNKQMTILRVMENFIRI